MSRFQRQLVLKSDDTIARIKDLNTIGKALEYLESSYTSKKDFLVQEIRVNCVQYPIRRPFRN